MVHAQFTIDVRPEAPAALQDNGALTNQELAEIVHLSASQCSRRRQRLEQEGVIRRYRADLDPASSDLV